MDPVDIIEFEARPGRFLFPPAYFYHRDAHQTVHESGIDCRGLQLRDTGRMIDDRRFFNCFHAQGMLPSGRPNRLKAPRQAGRGYVPRVDVA